MPIREINTEITAVQTSLVPVARTATATSDALDLLGYDACDVLISVGAVTTDAEVTPSLTECATSDGSFTAVAETDLVGSFALLAANTPQSVGYRGSKRYIKVVLTAADTKSVTSGVTLLKGYAHRAG